MQKWPRWEPVTLNTAEYGVLLYIYSPWQLEREIEWMMRFFWKIRQRTHDSKRLFSYLCKLAHVVVCSNNNNNNNNWTLLIMCSNRCGFWLTCSVILHPCMNFWPNVVLKLYRLQLRYIRMCILWSCANFWLSFILKLHCFQLWKLVCHLLLWHIY